MKKTQFHFVCVVCVCVCVCVFCSRTYCAYIVLRFFGSVAAKKNDIDSIFCASTDELREAGHLLLPQII